MLPHEEHNEQIDAWNNLATVIKFLLMEQYIKKETAGDLIVSLNKLQPILEELKEDIEEEIIPQYKQQPGFINEKEQTLKTVANKLVRIVNGIIKITDEEFKEMEQIFITTLDKIIGLK